MLASLSLDELVASDASYSSVKRAVFEKIKSTLQVSSKIIAITGAGISVSAGIPDFRSADGLYARVLYQHKEANSQPKENKTDDCNVNSEPTPRVASTAAETGKTTTTTTTTTTSLTVKGKDFFDAALFHNSATRPIFNRFVAELKRLCSSGEPTPTHQYLKRLMDEGKLIRWYTQNIDGIETRLGLATSCDVPLPADSCNGIGSSNNASFTKGVPNRPKVVALHGTLDRLICTVCRAMFPFEAGQLTLFRQGQSPSCDKCAAYGAQRLANGRRAVRMGILRPDIVLYNEPHPQADLIGEYLMADLGRRPTVLLVMGTSLKVVGLKRMVKDLAKAVHSGGGGGLVIYINKTSAARSEWKSIFDFELIGECDRWVDLLQPSSLAQVTTTAKQSLLQQTVSTASKKIDPASYGTQQTASKGILIDGRIDKLFRLRRTTGSSKTPSSTLKSIEKAVDPPSSPPRYRLPENGSNSSSPKLLS